MSRQPQPVQLLLTRKVWHESLGNFVCHHSLIPSPSILLPPSEPEAKQGDDPSGGGGATLTPADDGDDAPVLLSLESSPEFMQLPLEYQGYCPWTIVSRQGLLLPGDPTLGVVRYRNSFHVFTSEKALTQFMQVPSHAVVCCVSPAYTHSLASFPLLSTSHTS